jgi:uncharacterized protein YeaO (DUF488 family)
MPQRRDIELRRVYDDTDRSHAGYRVLVDRLWPRGITKADAALDEWLKEAAPSTDLRRWYGHDVARFEEFARRYRAELRRPPASVAVEHLIELARTHTTTLLTATRDVEHSGARVLHQVVTSRASRPGRRASPRHSPDDPVNRRDRRNDSHGDEGSTKGRHRVQSPGAGPG